MMARTQGKYGFAILHTHAGFVRLIHFYMFAKFKAFIAFATFDLSSFIFFGLMTLLDPSFHYSFKFKATFYLSSFVFFGLMTLLDPSFH